MAAMPISYVVSLSFYPPHLQQTFVVLFPGGVGLHVPTDRHALYPVALGLFTVTFRLFSYSPLHSRSSFCNAW